MHNEILSKEQVALLPLIVEFAEEFILVGDTATALYLGQRKSIDFGLFSFYDEETIKRTLVELSIS